MKGSRKPVEALSWCREGQSNLKRDERLKSWPFPTYKGQPLEPVKYPKRSAYPVGTLPALL